MQKNPNSEDYNSYVYIDIKLKLFRSLLAIACVASFLISILNVINHLPIISVIISLIATVLCLILFILSKQNRNNLIIQIFYFTFFNVIFIPLGWLNSPGSNSAMPFYAILAITLSIAFIERLWRFVFPIISLLEVLILIQYERYHPSAMATYTNTYSRYYDLSLSFIVISIILFIVFWTINKIIEKERQMLYDLSVTDQLTKLYNRRFLIDSLEVHINLVHRNKGKFTILIIDINNFKTLNDLYGHIEGDKVLKYIGNLLINSSRNYDICGRYGGDEFLVIMPETTCQEATEFAERILVFFNEFAEKYSKTNLSFSYGVSEGIGVDIDEFVTKADENLYNMKSKTKALGYNK
jgi:diguanylate cyclase (GGDEF)-like protein